ncbi:MAG: winged helix-turn-helix domain-containing protein [Fimbriimonadales bacterium]
MKPEFRIDREQIRLLTNPTRLELYTSLRTDGPATAKELARRMGADEMILYYHLRRLAGKSLLDTEHRPTATKPETVFSVRGRMVVEDLDLEDERNLRDVQRNVGAILRATSRECQAAATQLRNDFNGRATIGRLAVRLTDDKARELRRRLRELSAWLDENSEEGGDRYSLTFVAVPIVPKKAAGA